MIRSKNEQIEEWKIRVKTCSVESEKSRGKKKGDKVRSFSISSDDLYSNLHECAIISDKILSFLNLVDF